MFELGMKVVCIDASGTHGDSAGKSRKLVEGQIYIIERMTVNPGIH